MAGCIILELPKRESLMANRFLITKGSSSPVDHIDIWNPVTTECRSWYLSNYHYLAAGGFAQVYRVALARGATEDFLLKVFKRRRWRKDFQREVDILQDLQNIAEIPRLIDHGYEQSGRLCIVTEYVDGLNLTQYVRKHGPLTEVQCTALIASLLTVLKTIHAQGIVHSDIQPENIIFDGETATLIDWGIALRSDLDPQKEGIKAHKGYAAPECYISDVTSAADFYGLGWTIVFALSGTGPFGWTASDGDDYGVLAHCLARPEMPAKIPQKFLSLIFNWINKSPEKRTQVYDLPLLLECTRGSADDFSGYISVEEIRRRDDFLNYAAESNIRYSQHKLGSDLYDKKKYDESEQWLRRSYENGLKKSADLLVSCLESQVSKPDKGEIEFLLRDAADHHCAHAAYRLGKRLKQGRIVDSHGEAEKYLALAASLDSRDGLFEYGRLLLFRAETAATGARLLQYSAQQGCRAAVKLLKKESLRRSAPRLSKPREAYIGALVLANNPFLGQLDDLLTSEECQYLATSAERGCYVAGRLFPVDDNQAQKSSEGNRSLAKSADSTLLMLVEKIADLVGLSLDQAEPLQFERYGPERICCEYYDAWDLSSQEGLVACQFGGQRVVTIAIYIKIADEGGGARFPMLGIDVAPKIGRAVILNTATHNYTRPHPNSLRTEMPVIHGEQTVCYIHFRARPLDERQDFSAYVINGELGIPLARQSFMRMDRLDTTNNFFLRTNRARAVLEDAAREIQDAAIPLPSPVAFCYWDRAFGDNMDTLFLPQNTKIIARIPNAKAHWLLNKKLLARGLKKQGLDALAPPTYETVIDARKCSNLSVPLWFVKVCTATGGRGMCVVRDTELEAQILDENQIIQAAVSDIMLIDGRKFVARVYCLLWHGAVYIYTNGFTMIHGVIYDPDSTDYRVQIDHSGYHDASGPVQMRSLSSYAHYKRYFPKLKTMVEALTPVFSAQLDETSQDDYLILGIDTLLLTDGSVKLIDINTSASFIHTNEINNQVNKPFFTAVMRTVLGGNDSLLVKL